MTGAWSEDLGTGTEGAPTRPSLCSCLVQHSRETPKPFLPWGSAPGLPLWGDTSPSCAL